MRKLRILCIEDSEDDFTFIQRHLRQEHIAHEAQRVETEQEMLAAIDGAAWDVLICDHNLPHFNSLRALTVYHARALDIPFIIVSASIDDEIVIEAIRQGAHDIVLKTNLPRLGSVVKRELQQADIRRDRARANEEVALLRSITDSISQAENFSEALYIALEKICLTTNWNFGEAWIPDEAAEMLRLHPTWFGDPATAQTLRNESETIVFRKGMGLPGRVWESMKPEWIPDVSVNSHIFLRAKSAIGSGLQAGLAIPVMTNGEVLAVLGFFTSESNTVQVRLVDIISTVATELGSIFRRKKAEDALRKSEEQHRMIVENITEIIYRITFKKDVLHGDVEYMSKRAEEIIGYSEKDFRTDTSLWFKSIHPDDAPRVKEQTENIVRAKQAGTRHYRIRNVRSGIYRWIEDHIVPLLNDSGEVTGIQGAARDVTEKYSAMQALRESEERMRKFFEISQEGILIHDKGIILDANQALANLSGYTEEDLIGMNGLALLRKEDQIIAGHNMVTGFDKPYEVVGIRKDGTQIPLELIGKTLKIDHKEIRIVSVRDISDRKHAEVAVRESEERYRRVIKQSADPIYTYEVPTQKIIEANRAFLTLLGYEAMDLASLTLNDIVAHTPESIDAYLTRLSSEGSIIIGERKWKRKDGSLIDVDVTASIIHYHGRDLVFVIARDITEKKRAEKELIDAKERAELSDRLKDAFIANISHEIRTPLNIMLGYGGLIEAEIQKHMTPDLEKFFDSVNRGAERLMRTVEQILNLSSLQTGTYHFHPARYDITAHVKKMIDDFQPLANEKGLQLQYVQDCEAEEVMVDVYSFEQAFTNLLENAIKFTHAGSIIVHTSRENDRFILSVLDTGVGISEQYLPNVFDPFSQEIVGYSRPFEGLGLGMALTKRYLEINHGSISIESKKGEGTNVTITIPFHVPSTSQVQKAEQTVNIQKVFPHEPVGSGKSMLVVEDDEQSQEYVKIIFQKEFDIAVAISADDAWEILLSRPVDIILMDLSLSGDVDGLQMTALIRQTDSLKHIPIIALTAHAFMSDRRRSFEAGCNEFLTKPFPREKLVTTVRQLLKKHT